MLLQFLYFHKAVNMKAALCVFLALFVLAQSVDIPVASCFSTEIAKPGTETKTACARLYTEGCEPVLVKPGEKGSLRRSHGPGMKVTVSEGCVLQLWSPEGNQVAGSASLGQGEYATELPALLKELASVYQCDCGQLEAHSRSKRATYNDFLNRHIISPSPLPNTNQDWTQLMINRGIFGRPINTFIHGEIDQILQAFDLEDKKLQYRNRVGLVHWSKYRMPTTNLRLGENQYMVAVKARPKYVALSFRNGLPVHLDKVSSRSPENRQN